MLGNHEKAMLVLNALPHLGPVTVGRLLERFGGDPVALMQGTEKEWMDVEGVGKKIAGTLGDWREHFDLQGELAKMGNLGVGFVARGRDGFPSLLEKTGDAPIGLYKLGSLDLDKIRGIAIVGTRRPTLYGQRIAKKVASKLARAGFCIVSGMARGVDTAAHEGALEVGGQTVGVLGCGIDVVYPPENQGLYRRIASEGALLSEFPLGRRADRQTFPMRNRLVAGMCEGVVVVESAMKGGSLITARQAGEQGRSVFAFPGRVDQETSAGCHALIRDGAVLVTSAEDILDDLLGGGRQGVLDLQIEVEGKRQEAGIAELAEDEKKVYGALEDGATLGLEEIANTAGVEARVAAVTLMSLELKRLVAKRLDGKFERR